MKEHLFLSSTLSSSLEVLPSSLQQRRSNLTPRQLDNGGGRMKKTVSWIHWHVWYNGRSLFRVSFSPLGSNCLLRKRTCNVLSVTVSFCSLFILTVLHGLLSFTERDTQLDSLGSWLCLYVYYSWLWQQQWTPEFTERKEGFWLYRFNKDSFFESETMNLECVLCDDGRTFSLWQKKL
jgi:hypothetical protein